MKEKRSKIIVRRTFGSEDLLDLYADYVAEKILKMMSDSMEENASGKEDTPADAVQKELSEP